MFKTELLPVAIRVAGFVQLAIAASSLFIPRVLGWRRDVARLQPLTARVFWTYSGYVLATNIAFGLLSALMPERLAEHSPLAIAVTAFIGVYWLSRLVIQFAIFDRVEAANAPLFRVARLLYVTAFVSLTAVYSVTAIQGLS
jgi:surface polysaccharide O-acyltransferase-like enzyme